MTDAILIRGLVIESCVGVPDSEMLHPQRLQVDAEIFLVLGFREIGDDVSRTVDYDKVSFLLRREAAARPRRLIESLAYDLAAAILREFPARAVNVEIRKFLLSGVDWVGVRHSATRS